MDEIIGEYAAKGYIKPVLTLGGKWRFSEEDVERLMNFIIGRKVVLYARVSSRSQKDDLELQHSQGAFLSISYASHWVDAIIRTAYSIMESWRKKYLKGRARKVMPRVRRSLLDVK